MLVDGLTCAVSAALFGGACAVPFALRAVRTRRWGLPVRVEIVEDGLTPDVVAGYLAQIAQRLDEQPERMRVVFHADVPKTRAITLDLGADRALRVTVAGAPPKRVDLRGRWIVEHPLPLDLRRAVLYVKPVDANRFRVMARIPFRVSPLLYVACSLLATVGVVWVVPELVAAVAGLAFGASMCRRR